MNKKLHERDRLTEVSAFLYLAMLLLSLIFISQHPIIMSIIYGYHSDSSQKQRKKCFFFTQLYYLFSPSSVWIWIWKIFCYLSERSLHAQTHTHMLQQQLRWIQSSTTDFIFYTIHFFLHQLCCLKIFFTHCVSHGDRMYCQAQQVVGLSILIVQQRTELIAANMTWNCQIAVVILMKCSLSNIICSKGAVCMWKYICSKLNMYNVFYSWE